MGAQRWLKFGMINVQAAEFMKILIILILSQYFNNIHSNINNSLSIHLITFLLVIIPVLLIIKQPNLGTGIIITMNIIIILYLIGIKISYFLILVCILATMAPIFWNVLYPYQKQRLIVFFYPEQDPLGAGYNILQSIISIGSGGFYGKGFLQGSQNQLKFLPENHTDFIFALIAEEGGFLICVIIFVIYIIVLILLLFFSLNCCSRFQRIFIGGYAALLFLHVYINIAMISGLIPVVGVPLPFISYGGSNILAMTIGASLVVNFVVTK